MLEPIQLFPMLLLGAIIALMLILIPLIKADSPQQAEPPAEEARPPLLPRAGLSGETQPLRTNPHAETQPMKIRPER
jgi:hypothetical protein